MKHMIIVALFFFVTVYIVVLSKSQFKQTQFFSDIVASQAWSRKFYCAWNILFITFCSLFFYGYLIPELELSVFTTVIISLFLITTLAIGIFPKTGKTKGVHQVASSTAGLCIIPLLVALTIDTWHQLPLCFYGFEILYLVFAITVTISLMMRKPYLYRYILIYQTILIWGVMALIVMLAYAA